MPVRGCMQETIRHVPMTTDTRRKWLGDIIPTGFGKASVGDFLIAAGLMGGWATRAEFAYAKLAAVFCLAWWASGWFRGFGLFEKWPKEARRDARKNILIMLVLMAVGNLVNLRGCSIGAMSASLKGAGDALLAKELPASTSKPESKWRDLGKIIAPSHEIFTRLRQETAKREQEAREAQKVRELLRTKVQKQMAEIQRNPVSHIQQLRIRDLQKTEQPSFIISQNADGFLYKTYDGAVRRWTLHGGTEELAPAVQQPTQQQITQQWIQAAWGAQSIGTRKGPFCRITCEFHHGDNAGAGTGDVEVDADYCKKGIIPPTDYEVPGWIAIDAQYERKNPWPGPAGGGLDHYRLYWK
jgi:hypothetical protein